MVRHPAKNLTIALALSCAIVACKDEAKAPETKAPETKAPESKAPAKASDTKAPAKPAANKGATLDYPGTKEGAEKLLKSFLAPGADVAKLSAALRPTTKDYQAIFKGDAAAKAESVYKAPWDRGMMVIKPKAGQTELLLMSATSEDLVAGNDQAKQFPGGWSKVTQHLQPKLTFYRFKFVKPGEKLGMAFDGLTHVNGHWVIAPKPWRALR